jgi:hypothetical protein
MTLTGIAVSRRTFLRRLAGGGLALALVPAALRRAAAMGYKPPEGIYKIEGEVRVNGAIAMVGDPVRPGDVVTTGAESRAVFIIGKDVYLLRADSHLALNAEAAQSLKLGIADVLRIANGRLLAVFGKGRKRLETPTAIAGVRGTGIYVEAEPRRAYICTCYGSVNLIPRAAPSESETVHTHHHEEPRFIYASPSAADQNRLIVPAPVFDHTDTELVWLESLVRREPPFVRDRGGGGGY